MPYRQFLHSQAGFAALLSTLVVMAVVLTIVAGLSLVTIVEQKISANVGYSAQAYYAAESGIEDSLLRLIKNHAYSTTNNFTVGSSTVAITIEESSSQKNILARGQKNDRFRSLRVILNTGGQNTGFYYGVQVGEGGLTMDNNSRVEGNIHSNGSIQGGNGTVITGDVWVANSALDANQQSLTNNHDFALGQASPWIDGAQSFTPSLTGNLIKVSLLLKKTGGPPDRTVRLLTDDNNHPSKTLVASGSYGQLIAARVSATEYAWVDVALNSPTPLQAGTKYWLAFDSSLNEDNYFIWGQDSTDGYGGGTGQYSPNWSATSPSWSSADGDLAFKAWFGQANNFLRQVAIGADAHANTIRNSTITGDAYYQTLESTTVNGTRYPGSADPAAASLPISSATQELWKTEAETGGAFSGNYIVDAGEERVLGPQKIVGNLVVSNGGDLTVSGTLYVTGNVNIFNNAKVRLGANYGSNSGVIITDGSIEVANGCLFYDNGNDGYLLFLSAKSGLAIDLSNNSETAIFYAPNGTINVNNNATLKELTAYQVHLNNGARVIYESGLASVNFSAGVSGSWEVVNWVEVP